MPSFRLLLRPQVQKRIRFIFQTFLWCCKHWAAFYLFFHSCQNPTCASASLEDLKILVTVQFDVTNVPHHKHYSCGIKEAFSLLQTSADMEIIRCTLRLFLELFRDLCCDAFTKNYNWYIYRLCRKQMHLKATTDDFSIFQFPKRKIPVSVISDKLCSGSAY